MFIRRVLLTVIATVAQSCSLPTPTSAQPYPNKLIRIVAPFPPGGPTDGAARLIADRLSSLLGQTIVVENRPGGAGGTVGVKSVASADPDGYTILFTPPGPLVTAPAIFRNVGYDPAEGVRAGGGGVLLTADPGGQSERAGEIDAGARRVRQGQSGQGQLRVARLRHAAASARRDAQADDRRRHRARALQGLRAGAHRSDRRPGADVSSTRRRSCCRMSRAASCACWRSPTKSASRNFPIRRPRSRPVSASCRRATGSACWCRRARRRRSSSASTRAINEVMKSHGDGGDAGEAHRAGAARHAAGFRRLHGGGNEEMDGDDHRREYQGGLSGVTLSY